MDQQCLGDVIYPTGLPALLSSKSYFGEVKSTKQTTRVDDHSTQQCVDWG